MRSLSSLPIVMTLVGGWPLLTDLGPLSAASKQQPPGSEDQAVKTVALND